MALPAPARPAPAAPASVPGRITAPDRATGPAVPAPAAAQDEPSGLRERRRIGTSRFVPLETRRDPLGSVLVVTVVASVVSVVSGSLFGALRG
ncbi:hypothetical protein GCM10010468_80530 [Actinocorallia longicatena]|uniref:Uncharacterized protein n=1 Tax=Actinocorallia longicatena TaxID=111803 RepID=A0ABP6QMH9_9ACTN